MVVTIDLLRLSKLGLSLPGASTQGILSAGREQGRVPWKNSTSAAAQILAYVKVPPWDDVVLVVAEDRGDEGFIAIRAGEIVPLEEALSVADPLVCFQAVKD